MADFEEQRPFATGLTYSYSQDNQVSVTFCPGACCFQDAADADAYEAWQPQAPDGSSPKSFSATASCFESALIQALAQGGIHLDMMSLSRGAAAKNQLEQRLAAGNPLQICAAYEALYTGMTLEEICRVSGIEASVLETLQNLVLFEMRVERLRLYHVRLSRCLYREAKALGYADADILRLGGWESIPQA